VAADECNIHPPRRSRELSRRLGGQRERTFELRFRGEPGEALRAVFPEFVLRPDGRDKSDGRDARADPEP